MRLKKHEYYILSQGENVFRIFCQWIKLNHSWHKSKYDDKGCYIEWIALDYGKTEIDVHISRLSRVNKWALKTLRCTYIDAYQKYLVAAWISAIDWKYNNNYFRSIIFHKNFGPLSYNLRDWHNNKHKYLLQLKKAFKKNKWKYKEKILKTYGHAQIVVEIEEYPDYDMISDPLDDYYDPKLKHFL